MVKYTTNLSKLVKFGGREGWPQVYKSPGKNKILRKRNECQTRDSNCDFQLSSHLQCFFMEIMGNFVRLFSSLDVSDFRVQIGGNAAHFL